MRLKMEISKRLYYLQTKIEATRRNVANDFRIHFCYVIITTKRLCQWNAIKCSIKGILTKIAASVFHRI